MTYRWWLVNLVYLHVALHCLQIEGLYSKYERTGGSSAFAVDRHANKAFVYWESKVRLTLSSN